jgi:hypothetical protein
MREARLRQLLTLFTFEQKGRLKRYARNVVVHQREFVDIVLACDQGLLPLHHRARYHRSVPPELVPSVDELATLAQAKGGFKGQERRTIRRLGQFFARSYWSAGHMFYAPGLLEWHFFVFDRWDQAEGRPAHWAHGRHVHFVNWLWPELRPDEVWSRFVSKGEKPAGSLHIRDADPAAEQRDEADEA